MNNSFLKPIVTFVKGPGKSVVFTVLFYAVWIIVNRVLETTYALTRFEGRHIGVATLEAFDVGARVRLFYGSVVVFLVSLCVGFALAYLIYRKVPALLTSVENRFINYVSVGGLFLFVFKLFEVEVYETQELIYATHKILLIGLVLRLWLGKGQTWTGDAYIAVFAWSFSVYFLIRDCADFLGNATNPDFYIFTTISAIAILLAIHLRAKNPLPNSLQHRRTYVMLPVLLLPVLSILKVEIYLVLKANGHTEYSVGVIYAGLFMLLCWWVFRRWMKSRHMQHFSRHLIARQYLPVLIFSLTAYAAYSVYMDYYEEIFESGNVYLPLMEFEKFGVLAPLEKLNTHLLSDYFFGAIYTFFNGLNLSEVDLYDFLLVPISFTLYYYLVLYLSGNAFFAFFGIFVFPFAEAMMPSGYCLGILGLVALGKVIHGKQHARVYYGFFFTLLFLVLWRIDLAYVSVIAMPLLVLYAHVSDGPFRIQWRILGKAFAVILALCGTVVLVLAMCRHIDVAEKLQYFLHYARSEQSYGYNTVGWSNLPGYKMHYFVFPVLMAISVMALLVQRKKFTGNKQQSMAYLAMLFLVLFYFLNFNRGIIRHSLIEWTDTFTASFVYIGLSALPFFFLPKWSHTAKAVAFGVIAFVLVANYRVPDTKGLQSQFEKLIIKLKTTKNTELSELKSRVKNKPANAGAKYKSFVDFIARQCQESETFIDFSNKGMFYFYTQKETPSWFYQNPLCVQDDYLQTHFIADLKKYKVPFLLFQELNTEGYDFVDQVPNVLRHYRMAEYFYAHYEPAVILGTYCVWKQKGRRLTNKIDTVVREMPMADTGQAKPSLDWTLHTPSSKMYYAKIDFAKGHENENPDIVCDSKDTAYVEPPKIFRLSARSVFVLFDFAKSTNRVWLRNPAKALASVQVMACDYVPDELYIRSCTYHFRKLPAVWGKYDAAVAAEKPVWEMARSLQECRDTLCVDIPETLDKSGPTNLLITAENTDKDVQKVQLVFDRKGQAQQTLIDFDVLPGDKPEKYAIRVSSIYHWHKGINRIKLVSANGKAVKIGTIAISKAE